MTNAQPTNIVPMFPHPHDVPYPNRDTFLTMLGAVEADRQTIEHVSRDQRLCPYCDAVFNDRIHRRGSWRWPRELNHHILEHNAHPDAQFAAFIEQEYSSL